MDIARQNPVHSAPPPGPLPWPKLAYFLWVRGLRPIDVAEVFGCAAGSVWRYCLPFGHQSRRIPPADIIERICVWSGGEVTAADHYPPRMNGPLANPGHTSEEARV